MSILCTGQRTCLLFYTGNDNPPRFSANGGNAKRMSYDDAKKLRDRLAKQGYTLFIEPDEYAERFDINGSGR